MLSKSIVPSLFSCIGKYLWLYLQGPCSTQSSVWAIKKSNQDRSPSCGNEDCQTTRSLHASDDLWWSQWGQTHSRKNRVGFLKLWFWHLLIFISAWSNSYQTASRLELRMLQRRSLIFTMIWKEKLKSKPSMSTWNWQEVSQHLVFTSLLWG